MLVVLHVRAVIALTLYTAAFVCEAVRSGINCVGVGQAEAARAIGLTFGQTLRLVVLPQALRTVVPPLINVFIALTKNTSIAVGFFVAELIGVGIAADQPTRRRRVVILLGIAVFYLLITIPAGHPGRPARAQGGVRPMSVGPATTPRVRGPAGGRGIGRSSPASCCSRSWCWPCLRLASNGHVRRRALGRLHRGQPRRCAGPARRGLGATLQAAAVAAALALLARRPARRRPAVRAPLVRLAAAVCDRAVPRRCPSSC